MKMKWNNAAAIGLLGIGSLQLVGYALGSKDLRAVGLASGIAPFTKVFCAADGYEAFAARFHLEGDRADGGRWSREMTPELYAGLSGPYNRRNVYGAALAFAPRLPADLRDSVITRALEPGSAMRRELGVPADVSNLRVRIIPREGGDGGPWIFQPSATGSDP